MDLEMIPNWHPLFVHYTITLITLGVGFYILSSLLPNGSKWQKDLFKVSLWFLWLAGGFTIMTVIAGLHAYQTVGHDGPSHAAMTDHKNWALGTALLLFVILGLLKFSSASLRPSFISILLLALLFGGVLVTGYKGSELVYRYGLGVLSMPSSLGGHEDHHKTDGGHKHDAHEHGSPKAKVPEQKKTDQKKQAPETLENTVQEHKAHDHGTHEHKSDEHKTDDHGDVKAGEKKPETTNSDVSPPPKQKVAPQDKPHNHDGHTH